LRANIAGYGIGSAVDLVQRTAAEKTRDQRGGKRIPCPDGIHHLYREPRVFGTAFLRDQETTDTVPVGKVGSMEISSVDNVAS
jgi:hypothetical protein